MLDELTALGECMKRRRKDAKLTLAELAARTGLSAGLLSKVENARTSPSLPVLCLVAEALGCAPGDLFGAGVPAAAGETSRRRWIHVPAGRSRPVTRENSSGYDYRLILESRLNAGRMQIMLLSMAPGGKRKAVSGSGAEALYILEGRCRYHLGRDVVELAPGDTLFFDSALPHVPENPGPETLRVLVHYYLNEPVF